MAKGRKTGGKDFSKGEGGRRPGSRNKLPGGVKKNLIEHLRTLEDDRSEELTALFDKILSKGGREAIALLELALAYLHGKPVQRVAVQELQPIQIIVPACPQCGRTLVPPPETPKALAAALEEEVEVAVQRPIIRESRRLP